MVRIDVTLYALSDSHFFVCFFNKVVYAIWRSQLIGRACDAENGQGIGFVEEVQRTFPALMDVRASNLL